MCNEQTHNLAPTSATHLSSPHDADSQTCTHHFRTIMEHLLGANISSNTMLFRASERCTHTAEDRVVQHANQYL